MLQVLTVAHQLHCDYHKISDDPCHSLQEKYDLKMFLTYFLLPQICHLFTKHSTLLLAFGPAIITYLLLPSVAGVIAAFYSSFLSVIFLEMPTPCLSLVEKSLYRPVTSHVSLFFVERTWDSVHGVPATATSTAKWNRSICPLEHFHGEQAAIGVVSQWPA